MHHTQSRFHPIKYRKQLRVNMYTKNVQKLTSTTSPECEFENEGGDSCCDCCLKPLFGKGGDCELDDTLGNHGNLNTRGGSVNDCVCRCGVINSSESVVKFDMDDEVEDLGMSRAAAAAALRLRMEFARYSPFVCTFLRASLSSFPASPRELKIGKPYLVGVLWVIWNRKWTSTNNSNMTRCGTYTSLEL